MQHKHKPILTQTSIINIFFKRSIGNNLFYAILQRLEKCSEDLQKVFRGIARYPQAQLYNNSSLFHDRVPYLIETSPLICSANQWTDFYMVGNSVIIELKVLSSFVCGSLQYTSGLYNTFGRIVIWIKNIFSFFRHLRKKD